MERFYTEACAAANLDHSGILPVYEINHFKGQHFFTMLLVDGGSLSDRLQKEVLSAKDAAELLCELADTVHYAHTNGIIHRDLKPANILVGEFGEVTVLDWGLAKVWHPDGRGASEGDSGSSKGPHIEDISLTGHGKAQGTIHYMSPEQLNLDPSIDHRTDIFSLGAVLYEILCGNKPAAGEKMHEVVESVLNDQPPEATEVSSQVVPRLLNDVAMKCLSKNPEDRFQSMEEMVILLQQNWQTELSRFTS